MSFLCFKSQVPAWFLAAAKDDNQYIQDHISKYAGKYDLRETNVEKLVVNGLAAIHYSVIFHSFNALRLLLPAEYALTTKEVLQIQTPLLPRAKAFQLAAGQDALHLALARGHFQMAREILAYTPPAGQRKLLENVDDDGHTHLMLLGYFPLTDDIYQLITQTALVDEFPVYVEGRSFLYVLCQMKRLQTLQLVLMLIDKFPQFKESFYLQMTEIYAGKTLFDVLATDIDYSKCSSDPGNKGKINKILSSLLPQAIRFLETDKNRFQQHLTEFHELYKHEIDMSKPEIDLREYYDSSVQTTAAVSTQITAQDKNTHSSQVMQISPVAPQKEEEEKKNEAKEDEKPIQEEKDDEGEKEVESSHNDSQASKSVDNKPENEKDSHSTQEMEESKKSAEQSVENSRSSSRQHTETRTVEQEVPGTVSTAESAEIL